jgi:hypothetical protein
VRDRGVVDRLRVGRPDSAARPLENQCRAEPEKERLRRAHAYPLASLTDGTFQGAGRSVKSV